MRSVRPVSELDEMKMLRHTERNQWTGMYTGVLQIASATSMVKTSPHENKIYSGSTAESGTAIAPWLQLHISGTCCGLDPNSKRNNRLKFFDQI